MAKSKGNPFVKEDSNESPTQKEAALQVAGGLIEEIDQKIQRVYKDAKTIHHDLYKLEVGSFMKNLAVSGSDDLDLVKVEHCHFFHTVNSEGKQQTNSSMIAGHFHIMKITPQKDGPPKVTCASGPMMFARKSTIDAKGKRKFKTVIVPINDYDNHTHKVTYLRSTEVKQRVINTEAVQVETHWGSHAAPPPEVI